METETKQKIDTKKLIIVVLLILLTAGVVGGGVYYVLTQNFQKEREASKRALKESSDQIKVLTDKAVAGEAKQTQSVPTVTKKDTIEELRTFCLGTDSDVAVGSITYMENTNGVFGNCGIESKSEPGSGGMLISKKISNVWTKLWVGNGIVDEGLCTQYKIPNKMSGGTCPF